MRFKTLVLVIAIGLGNGAAASYAAPLGLKGNERWLSVANSDDVDTAIGIAKRYSGFGSKVVKSDVGRFSVVMGPYRAKSVAAISADKESPLEVPRDAELTKGQNFVDIVWDSGDPENEPAAVENLLSPLILDRPLKIEAEGITAEIVMPTKGDAAGPAKVVGFQGQNKVFEFELNSTGDNVFSSLGATAGFVRLDRTSEFPQLVVTRSTAGAHCCIKTWFVTKPAGKPDWVVVEGASLDGDGYNFPDLDADGAREIVSADNRFLYAFDSYAASFAPKQYGRLSGSELTDISKSSDVTSKLRQDLADIEFNAKIDPTLWRSNGFLAAWVASKVRLGQGEEAWTTALENYDRQSQFGPQECTSGQSLDSCPVENVKSIGFAKGLALFMQENGYGPLPQAALSYTQ